jgi:hypothetical protein
LAIGRVLQALPDGAVVTTPVLSSPVNIVINLFGERALLDMTSAGPGQRRGLQIIADTIASLHRRFLALSGDRRVHFYACSFRYAPQGFGHICGCATQLVGAGMYKDLLAPLDEQILSVYPEGGTIHLCGHHRQHIACWSRMPRLRGVEITDAAADDFEHYFPGLREDQVIYINPTKNMPAERILAISGGRRIVLQMKMDKPITPARTAG